MPKRIEERLKREAEKRGLEPGSDRYDAYVYGTLARIKRAEEGDGGKHHDN